ncbi:MAG: cytochrome c3 family protein [Gemmatimonadetes bacterium]|nr:cytochrome c3 family protein [Gemmatimonadota bacterium]
MTRVGGKTTGAPGGVGRFALTLSTVAALAVSSGAQLKPGGNGEVAPRGAAIPSSNSDRGAEDGFDHAVHAGLFPTCTGCHTGAVQRGDALFPATASCAACHDGEDLEEVDWEGSTPEPSILAFEHDAHIDAIAEADETTVCTSCHTEPSEASPAVAPRFEGCTGCHAHEVEDHTGGAACATCHTSLATVPALSQASVDFVRPADHDTPEFLAGLHGDEELFEQSRCATCHTSDRCAACHVDAGISQISELGAWPASTFLPAWENTYPVPASHEASGFDQAHWSAGGTASDCSTCHTRNDCTTCHTPPLDRWYGMADLTPRSAALAPGAELERRSPAGHATPGFGVHHQVEAEVSAGACATCHTEDSCAACHEGVRAPVYHEPGYEAGHAADAASRFMDCSACHDTVVFCRACHSESGIMDQSVGAAYHDAEPLWLLRHGQAARQTLEGCVSCHEQRDCTRCHSSLGAFRVSPHGPGFDPALAQDKNPRACTLCHLTDPIGR